MDLVKQVEDGQFYAAKINTDKKGFKNAKHELLMMRKLNHPNIIQLVDAYHSMEEDYVVIVMELCKSK